MLVLALIFGSLSCPLFAQEARTLGLPPVPVPAENSQTPEKVALGKTLFFDKRLSADGKISCANCHHPDRAFTDGLSVAEGIGNQRGTRNTPTLLNVVYFTSLFWDGRRTSLEEQAGDPFLNPIEHGFKAHDSLLLTIGSDPVYARRFKQTFGLGSTALKMDHVVRALAAFQRTLVAGNSPFDRYEYGGEKQALSDSAIRGLSIFRGRAKCQTCHTIGGKDALFTDNRFHSLGIGFKRIEQRLAEITMQVARKNGKDLDEAVLSRQEISELGRFVATLKPSDIGRFKTPSLRNVAITAPYMHDGSVGTLEEAVEAEIYYRGLQANRPLILTPQEKLDLVEFLRALTGASVHGVVPP
jgi:cytochrome c peroxidase